jgi:hypothetical protein
MCRSLRQLDEAVLEQILSAVVQRLVPQPTRPTAVAVDAAGLAPGAIYSTMSCTLPVQGFLFHHGSTWTGS